MDCYLKIEGGKTCLYATERDTPPCINNTGIDPSWCGRGAALQAVVQSCVGHVCHSPINILYLNCNCCSQFAYHHVIAQITVSHFVSIIFCFIIKKPPPPPPPPPPLVNLQLVKKNIGSVWTDWDMNGICFHSKPFKCIFFYLLCSCCS
jgi:hypothetical protein